jgi:hypothetical protein
MEELNLELSRVDVGILERVIEELKSVGYGERVILKLCHFRWLNVATISNEEM